MLCIHFGFQNIILWTCYFESYNVYYIFGIVYLGFSFIFVFVLDIWVCTRYFQDCTRYLANWDCIVLHQDEGGIGKSIPDGREISWDPRDFPRAKPEGNLEGRGDGFLNTSRGLVEYGHSLIINLSTGSGSENPFRWWWWWENDSSHTPWSSQTILNAYMLSSGKMYATDSLFRCIYAYMHISRIYLGELVGR